jgi:cobalt-zinc-cadmium efflux system protein
MGSGTGSGTEPEQSHGAASAGKRGRGRGHSHSHGHGHGHSHGPAGTAGAAYRGRLRIALGITLFVLTVEVVGSAVTGSLALLADAGHMATDAAGIAMALLAIHIANRPASERRTFGFARAEILAAVLNAVLLFGVGAFIFYEGVRRLVSPQHIDGGATVVFGLIGLAANSVSLVVLMRGQRESLNVRGAFLEVMADALGSLAVVLAAVVFLATGWRRADPVASLLIGLMIVPRTWQLLREAVDVLLEAAPKGVDHLGAAGAVGACGGQPGGPGGGGLREDAARPPGLPRRAFRRRALHLPAGAGRARGARGPALPLSGVRGEADLVPVVEREGWICPPVLPPAGPAPPPPHRRPMESRSRPGRTPPWRNRSCSNSSTRTV